MNKQKREKLKEASSHLSTARSLISFVKDQEQCDLDNFPENLQESERCRVMEEAIDELDEAIENIDRAHDNINNAI